MFRNAFKAVARVLVRKSVYRFQALRPMMNRSTNLFRTIRFHYCYSTSNSGNNNNNNNNPAVDYTFSFTKADQNEDARSSDQSFYVIMFTCGPCGNKMMRQLSKVAYHKGVVLIRCDKCEKIHLIADNLKWFEDKAWNVETHAAEQGQLVPKIKVDDPEIKEMLNKFLKKKTA